MGSSSRSDAIHSVQLAQMGRRESEQYLRLHPDSRSLPVLRGRQPVRRRSAASGHLPIQPLDGLRGDRAAMGNGLPRGRHSPAISPRTGAARHQRQWRPADRSQFRVPGSGRADNPRSTHSTRGHAPHNHESISSAHNTPRNHTTQERDHSHDHKPTTSAHGDVHKTDIPYRTSSISQFPLPHTRQLGSQLRRLRPSRSEHDGDLPSAGTDIGHPCPRQSPEQRSTIA